MKHTKGPWKIYPPCQDELGRNSLDVGVHDSEYSYGYKAIAQISPVNLDPKGTHEANANLIAAAPEMLEALELFQKALTYAYEQIDGIPVDEFWSKFEQANNYALVAIAKVAIAKAKGES